MKRTEVVRECVDALHTTEASLAATLASATQTLERLAAAKAELGLTGTVGDACMARLRDTVAALGEAEAALIEAHQGAYRIAKATNLRTSAGPVNPTLHVVEEDRLTA